MAIAVKLESQPESGGACRRRAVVLATMWCGMFFCLTTMYWYVYVLAVGNDYPTDVASVISCVSRDWLLWMISFPLLAHRAVRHDIATHAGRAAIIKLLVLHTLALGGVRMLGEMYWGGAAAAEVLLIYLPRYLFVTALLMLGGFFYVFKIEAEQRIRCLESLPDAAAASAAQAESPASTLVAYKGSSRVVVAVEDIACVTASGNYVELETSQGCFLLRSTMKEIAGQLCAARFVRVHRSHIVNLAAIESVSCGRLEAKLRCGKVIRIGRTYMNSLPQLA